MKQLTLSRILGIWQGDNNLGLGHQILPLFYHPHALLLIKTELRTKLILPLFKENVAAAVYIDSLYPHDIGEALEVRFARGPCVW